MPCKIQIKKKLETAVDERTRDGLAMSIKNARELGQKVNDRFGAKVVTFSLEGDYVSRDIHIPDSLINEYFHNEEELERRDDERRKRSGNWTVDDEGNVIPLFQQKSGTESSVASPKTISLIKELLAKIGVNIKSMQEIKVNGRKYDSNAIAQIMQKVIQVIDGKEAQSLPEEAMHFVVEIVKQKNPTLYKQLLREIGSYRLLNQVFADYANDPDYKTKEGTPNVIKLKEEAIAKVLAEIIIKKSEGITEKPELLQKTEGWWQQIIQFFKNLFATSGFDKVAMDIITGKFEGTAEDIKAEEDKIFSQKVSSQEEVYNHLKATAARIELKLDTKTGEDRYYIDGREIYNRVTNLVKDWYERMFADKSLTKSDYRKAVDDMKRDKGTRGHSDMNHAFNVLVDENGYLRETELDDDDYSPQLGDREMYDILKDNLRDRLKSYPAGTRFLSEITIYDPRKGGRDIAGTIDLLAIKPNGKVSIYDWKFMDLNIAKYEDVPWYKVKAWNKQMLQYKLILHNNYEIALEDFEHTRMIPILAVYDEGDREQKILPSLVEVKIGDVNIKNVKEDYLLPVGLQTEKTGNRRVDKFIEKLNDVYEILSNKKVSEEDKKNKADSLNSLFKAIRQLQVRGNVVPLIGQAKLLVDYAGKITAVYSTKYEGQDYNKFSETEVNQYAQELGDIMNIISSYTMLDVELSSIFEENVTEDDKKILDDLTKVSNDARRLKIKIDSTLEKFVNNVIAKREGVDSLLAPEKVIKGITKMFVTTAGLQLKSIEVLYKKANKAFAKAGFDTLSESKILEQIKSKYETWAKAKGLSKKNYFDIIKKKDSNELIDEFDKTFYSTLKSKALDKDTSWIIANVDIPAYREHLKEVLAKEIERIKNKPRILTQEEVDHFNATGEYPKEVEIEISLAEKLYDTETKDSLGWLVYEETKKFPKRDKWESAEWKELNKPENAPAKDFYDYIVTKNREYFDIGYITNPRTFLPYVKSGLIEKLLLSGKPLLLENFLRSISLDEGDVGFGQIDPLKGKPINKIPKYFTHEIEGSVSTDLFHTMALYNEAAIKYKYLSEIESQIDALVTIEQNKQAISTSIFGKTQYKDGEIQYTKDNTSNTKLLEDMQKMVIYGQKYISSETFDQLLFKLGGWGKKFNEKMGIKIFPEDISDRQVSINKIIDTLNNQFQLITLGLNPLSASSNFLGGNFQSIINAGKYFTKGDYAAAENMMFMNKFNGTDQKKMIGALEYFLPLTENYNREIAKKLSLNTLNQENIQDWLMILMRKTDLNVQTANFYAYLKNTIVMDGRLLNVREYLRSQPEYQNKYKGTEEQRKAFNEKFENEVEKLVREKGVLKLGKIEKVTREVAGKKYETEEFVIPGIDRYSDDVIKLRRTVQQLSKDALGNLTPDDLRMINATIIGKSMMVFKNWIPRPMDVRIGNLKYNAATDAYEWGRLRTVMRVLIEGDDGLIGRLENLYGSLAGNERGMKFVQQLYESKRRQYKEDTGKELKMTEAEFIDMVRANIKNQIYDVIMLLTLCLFVWGLKAVAPDDDENPAVINQHRFITKLATKFRGELMYFYDPTSITSMLSSGIFPSLTLVNNFTRTLTNFSKEMYGLTVGDDKLVKNTKVIKYVMKTFPITNQMTGYLPLFYPQLAKDLGIRTTANYSMIR